MSSSAVIEKIVKKNLCIGCGVCINSCDSQRLSMSFDDSIGINIPKLTIDSCEEEGNCIKVCPFNPEPLINVSNEDSIREELGMVSRKKNRTLGSYESIYAGFSKIHRENSSSGGIATWILNELLKRDIVNAAIVVKKSNNTEFIYEYSLVDNKKDLNDSSKTKYYPLSLDKILNVIDSFEGTVAITAIPCFLKAIRLKQFRDIQFKNKIKFTVGIFCGGLKTAFFTDYLSSRCSVEKDNIKEPQYRIKDPERHASDYLFGVKDKVNDELKTIRMREVGDMWGTGLFKPYACEFCDDLSSELADISLGDAWIPPYNKDGKGTNIIITRSETADDLIKKGIESDELELDILSEEKAILSQRGNVNHRHKGLGFRLFLKKITLKKIQKKRIKPSLLINPFFIMVLIQRERVRTNSFKYWNQYKNAEDFDKAMRKSKLLLGRLTRLNNKYKNILLKLK